MTRLQPTNEREQAELRTRSLIDRSASDERDEELATVHDRERCEFHETPIWCVADLLEYGHRSLRPIIEFPGCRIADPCAGHGRIQCAIDRWAIQQKVTRAPWVMHEIRAEAEPHLAPYAIGGQLTLGDFFAETKVDENVRLAIFNSPFSLTRAFVVKSWELYPYAHVASLQRANWLSSTSTDRANFLAKHNPRRYEFGAHRGRPSFRSDGKTDAQEYQWHVWLANERNAVEIPGGRRLQPLDYQLSLDGTP